MLSRFQGLFATSRCIFPQANTPLRKGVCVTTALVGLIAGVYGGYKSITYMNVAWKKVTDKIVDSMKSNDIKPNQTRFDYSKIINIGLLITMGVILSGGSLISGFFLFNNNKETYRAISGTTKCCDIIRKTTANTILSSIFIVLCLGCGWQAFTCFKKCEGRNVEKTKK